jgi:hypothetical protein
VNVAPVAGAIEIDLPNWLIRVDAGTLREVLAATR